MNETNVGEVSSVVHGHWENWDDGWFHGIRCSVCGKRYCKGEHIESCPACNALMDEKDNQN